MPLAADREEHRRIAPPLAWPARNESDAPSEGQRRPRNMTPSVLPFQNGPHIAIRMPRDQVCRYLVIDFAPPYAKSTR
jgi:hypothetical protein